LAKIKSPLNLKRAGSFPAWQYLSLSLHHLISLYSTIPELTKEAEHFYSAVLWIASRALSRHIIEAAFMTVAINFYCPCRSLGVLLMQGLLFCLPAREIQPCISSKVSTASSSLTPLIEKM
jgi:hypothetical protein